MAVHRAVDADPSFDRFARLIRDALGIPVALVSVVEHDRQIFPGMVGLPEPVSLERQTPLTHSFCQHVVADSAPLIITDAREDVRLRDNLAIEDLSVVAYAGFPLRDPDGTAIGSVCAIDSRPHAWTETELRMLAEIAELCSTELELRAARNALAESALAATEQSVRAQHLLAFSEQLADTRTTPDIALALDEAAAKHLDCTHAGLWLLDPEHQDLRYVAPPLGVWRSAERYPVFALDEGNPIGLPLVLREPIYYRDRADQLARFPAFGADETPVGEDARVTVPLVAGDQLLGTLVLVWAGARDFLPEDRTFVAALTSYTAQAVARAQLLAERTGAAATLQHALLTDLPHPEHLELAARYRTASVHDAVGGDWYDAVVMPTGATNLVIGDVVGHDIRAAAIMGSLRSLLRGFAWAIDDLPSANVARLDRAARDLGIRTMASLVFGRIEQTPEQRPCGERTFRWTNAGHPAPLLVDPNGCCRALDGGTSADLLIGIAPTRERHDHEVTILPGSTLLLFTDGLVETRDEDLDVGLARLVDSMRRHHGLPVGAMLDAILDDLLGDALGDDAAVLAVRFNPQH